MSRIAAFVTPLGVRSVVLPRWRGADGDLRRRRCRSSYSRKFTYTYAITPTQAVAPETAWTSEVNRGSVNLGFSGFVASESYQKQSTRHKGPFTMVDGSLANLVR